MNFQDDDERDATAGEYVLGTLAGAELAEFERALASDTSLQQAVYAWQDRLLGLASRVAPVAPPDSLWAGIAQRITPAGATASTPFGPVAGTQSAANEPLWQRLGVWRALSGLAVAACLMLATLLVLRQGDTPEPARYLAVLQDPGPDKTTGWIVEATAGRGVRLLPVGANAPVPAGKTLQFWTKAEGAAGPTSLGLVQAGQTVEVPLERLPALGERQLFELTLEPGGGSPYDRPSGPILFVGRTVRL